MSANVASQLKVRALTGSVGVEVSGVNLNDEFDDAIADQLRDALYNNPEDVAGSPLKSLAKLAYYHAFALLYGLVGAFAQVRQRGGSGAGAWGCGWLGATGVGERGEARQGRGQGCMIGRVM